MVVVVGACVTVVVVGACVVVVVVGACVTVVVVGACVVVVVVGACVVVVELVVVVVVPVSTTIQPVVVAEIGLEFVSKRLRIVSPIEVVVLTVPTTLNVILVTLTTPVGLVRLLDWNAEMFVVPVVNEAGSVVGAPENSAVFPPATDAIVRTVGS